MSGRKIIVVVGATGQEGGAVARALLHGAACESRGAGRSRPSTFAVRALTRDPASPAARRLAALGAEVVCASLCDALSIERAFAGAYGAYCVTHEWALCTPERELAYARTMATAAASAGLEHVIWSTSEDTRLLLTNDDACMPTLHGRYKVPHFDAKAEANTFFLAHGVPTTFLHTSFHWENFLQLGMHPTRNDDGTFAFTLPLGTAPLPGIAVNDIGHCVQAMLRQPQEYIGQFVGIAGEHLTGRELAAAFARALGEPVHYNAIPVDIYRGFHHAGAAELGNMFQCLAEYAECFAARRCVARTRALHPGVQTFDTWLATHRARLPLDEC